MVGNFPPMQAEDLHRSEIRTRYNHKIDHVLYIVIRRYLLGLADMIYETNQQ